MSSQSLTPPNVRPRARSAPAAAARLLLAGIAAMAAVGSMAALKGAGVTGTAPEGANGFQKLVGLLNDNLLWVFITCIGLAIVVGGVLMVFGHSRAQDHLIRIGGGVVVVMVLAPSVVA